MRLEAVRSQLANRFRKEAAMEKSGTEKSSFSNLYQVGVIVRDMDKAVEYYQDLGIGPFESLKVSPHDRRVYGKPADDVKNRVMHAQMGPVEFELVQPVSGESVQKEFLESRVEGINHLAFFVDDLEKEVSKLVEKGFKVISSGKRVGGGGFAYLDTGRVGGVIFELTQPS